MSVTVTYKITDTANNSVVILSLLREIADASLTPVLLGHEVSQLPSPNDDLSLIFSTALSGAEQTTLDGVIASHQGLLTTVTFQFVEDASEQQMSSQTFQTALALTTSPMQEGTYIAFYQSEVRVVAVSALDSAAQVRYQFNGSGKALSVQLLDDWVVVAAWDKIVLQSGDTPTFTVQWRRHPTTGGDDTIAIRKTKIGLVNVG